MSETRMKSSPGRGAVILESHAAWAIDSHRQIVIEERRTTRVCCRCYLGFLMQAGDCPFSTFCP